MKVFTDAEVNKIKFFLGKKYINYNGVDGSLETYYIKSVDIEDAVEVLDIDTIPRLSDELHDIDGHTLEKDFAEYMAVMAFKGRRRLEKNEDKVYLTDGVVDFQYNM